MKSVNMCIQYLEVISRESEFLISIIDNNNEIHK